MAAGILGLLVAHYEPVDVQPILAVQDGYIVTAAVVAGRMTRLGQAFLHVITWEAGRGERSDYLSPADFETWRRSFVRPSETN